jgi:hypothetical protein
MIHGFKRHGTFLLDENEAIPGVTEGATTEDPDAGISCGLLQPVETTRTQETADLLEHGRWHVTPQRGQSRRSARGAATPGLACMHRGARAGRTRQGARRLGSGCARGWTCTLGRARLHALSCAAAPASAGHATRLGERHGWALRRGGGARVRPPSSTAQGRARVREGHASRGTTPAERGRGNSGLPPTHNGRWPWLVVRVGGERWARKKRGTGKNVASTSLLHARTWAGAGWACAVTAQTRWRLGKGAAGRDVPTAAAGQVRARVAGGGPGRERRARWASATGLGKGARSWAKRPRWARVRAVWGKRLGLSQCFFISCSYFFYFLFYVIFF